MRGRTYIKWTLAAVMIGCIFSDPATAQLSADADAPPSIHVRNWLVVNPRAKIQLDFSGFRPELDDKPKVLQGRRIRIGADGTLLRDFAYSVRLETRKADPQFRDVFLKYQKFHFFQVQAGRFKIPFGLDQLTDSGDLNFVHRSRIGSIVAPGRDTGLMVLGEALEETIQYAAGVFRHDGRNSELEDFAAIHEERPGGDHTLAMRLTVQPAPLLPVRIPMRHFRLGTAFTRSNISTGLSSLGGVTVSNQLFFPRMYARGTRLRRGAELSGTLGSLLLQGELMDVREQRLGEGLRGQDLPPLRTQGWYVSAVQPVAGHINDASRGAFLRSILPGKRLGLLEATARYEVIRFGAVTSDGSTASRSSRAGNVIGNEDRAWTVGMNWHASRYLKLQFNGVREALRDPERSPIEGESRYWTIVGRAQVYF